jgi:hypothetical protein
MCTDVAIHCSASYRVLEFSLCQYANRPRSRDFPLLIVVTPGGATSQLDLTPISRGHQFSASRLNLDEIRNRGHRFPQHLHQGRHLFVPLHIVANLDVTGCEILRYDYRILDPIPQLAPGRVTFFILDAQFNRCPANVPNAFRHAFNFAQYPSFHFDYDRNTIAFLKEPSMHFDVLLPFPDMRTVRPEESERLKNFRAHHNNARPFLLQKIRRPS